MWHSFSKRQKEEQKLNINIAAVTSETTRVSKRLVSTIHKVGKESLEKGELCFSTPKGKEGAKKPRIPVDAFADSAIRQKICEFYVVTKECPSIRRLLKRKCS